MQRKKSLSSLLMLAIVFGFLFKGNFSSGWAFPTVFPKLRSTRNSTLLGNNRHVADGVGLKGHETEPGFDDELTSYLVKKGLYKAGCDMGCPGKCVAHPQTSEPICICERGKAINYRDFPHFCTDCGCGFGEISCLIKDLGPNKCYCEIGYESKDGRCVESERPCEGNPCKNGGSCWEKIDRTSYMCTCPETHTGRNCQQDLNSCASNPCQNGGVCWIGSGSDYLCVCPETHAGKNCQRKFHTCDKKPCKNGGTCYRGARSDYLCYCPANTGDDCATELDPCTSRPCKNGGTCWSGEEMKYYCSCGYDYKGKNCEQRT